MTASEYDRKIRVIDAKVQLLQAQRAELLHKRDAAKAQPPKKRAIPKKPSKKPAK